MPATAFGMCGLPTGLARYLSVLKVRLRWNRLRFCLAGLRSLPEAGSEAAARRRLRQRREALESLGLPEKDWQRLFDWSESAMELIGGLAEPASFAALYGDVEALQAYLGEHTALDNAGTRGSTGDTDDGGVIRLVSDAVVAGTIEMWEASGLLFHRCSLGTARGTRGNRNNPRLRSLGQTRLRVR
jgi:hypothetical protein